MINLEKLVIQGNSLTDIYEEICKLINLKYLDVSINSITEIPINILIVCTIN